MLLRYQSLWLREGKLYLPTMGKTPFGLYTEVEPVEILPPELGALVPRLEVALKREPPPTPDPPAGASWPTSVVQKAARQKSWLAFSKAALGIALIESEAGWDVAGTIAKGREPLEVEKISVGRTESAQVLGEAVLALAGRWSIWADQK